MTQMTSQEIQRMARDFLVGLAVFSAVAFFILDGRGPNDLPNHFTGALSIDANAAEPSRDPSTSWLPDPGITAKAAEPAEADTFRNTHGWTALAVMAMMFAMLYAFNLALFRRFFVRQRAVRTSRYPRR
ncbi:MAG: hypothetical protein RIC14_16125 [Filomicrobium sp.]